MVFEVYTSTFDSQLKHVWLISDLFATYLYLLSYVCVYTQSNLHEIIRKQISISIVLDLFQLLADRPDSDKLY